MRLGDYIDDHCTRCKRTTDHSIVAIVNDEVQKVMCRICHTEHKFHHNESGKKPLTKDEAFNKLLANATAQVEGAANTTTTKAKRKKSG